MNASRLLLCLFMPLILSCSRADLNFDRAMANGESANEGFRRCVHFVEGWLGEADPKTGLIPRNLERNRDIWNAKDSAADNYPFMVLTAAVCDRSLFEGRMLDMLETEKRLSSRIGALPDTYSFTKEGFETETPDHASIMFGSSEYIKDGLLPLTEWLGKSPWSERMIAILDDMWANAPLDTPFKKIVSDSHEINGEMLQTLSRVYFMTGDKKYLDWAVRLGDYYLSGGHHPTRDTDRLRLRDHGCEIVSGLCELYTALHFADRVKKEEYRDSLYDMLDTILEKGRNEHGLFYNGIDPRTGAVVMDGVADTWGYTLNGYYSVYLVDGHEPYREAVLKALGTIDANYRSFDWEHGSADGYADAIESALNLYNREAVPSAADWIDSEIRVMWGKQQESGIIEGWHGDGNFARTTIIYCLWKTQGTTARPWREYLLYGAVREGDVLGLKISADEPWEGVLLFDTARHKTVMNMPIDWPRINQFPEWFTVESDADYSVRGFGHGGKRTLKGSELINGLPLKLAAGESICLTVEKQ